MNLKCSVTEPSALWELDLCSCSFNACCMCNLKQNTPFSSLLYSAVLSMYLLQPSFPQNKLQCFTRLTLPSHTPQADVISDTNWWINGNISKATYTSFWRGGLLCGGERRSKNLVGRTRHLKFNACFSKNHIQKAD